MIKINKITPQVVELFNPQNESMGFINQYELNDIRIQIRKEQAEGYYCVFNEQILNIYKDGKMNWISGFFDLFERQLIQLF